MYRRNRELDRNREAYEIIKEDLLNDIEAQGRWENATRYRRQGLWGHIRRGDYNRDKARLRSSLARELRALQAVENRAGRTRDPLVREMLLDLLEDANEQGLTVNELAGYFNGGGLRGRLLPGGGQGMMSWLLPLLLVLVAVPSARQGLKPLAKKVVEGAMDITDKINELITSAKEEVEDIVAEAAFDKMKDMPIPEKPPSSDN